MGKTLIGWREYVSLPEWGVWGLRAKIDTGAHTSAIHVENLECVDDTRIRFDVVLDRRHKHRHVPVEATIVRISHVKSSNGENLPRYFVRTKLMLGEVDKEIEVSLVNRDNMKVRMLIGRTALGEDFLVDANRAHVTGKVVP